MLLMAIVACGTPAPSEAPSPPAAPTPPPPSEPETQPEAVPAIDEAESAEPVAQAPIEPRVSEAGVGFVHHDTTRDELIAKLGADAVQDHPFHQGEGMFLPGLALLPNTPFELRLQTDGTTVERIEVVGSAYQLDSGLHVGSDLGELRKALGTFSLYGYGWDYGGTVVSDQRPQGAFHVVLRTAPQRLDVQNLSPAALQVFRGGEKVFSSKGEGLEELDPHLSSIVLVWQKPPKVAEPQSERGRRRRK